MKNPHEGFVRPTGLHSARTPVLSRRREPKARDRVTLGGGRVADQWDGQTEQNQGTVGLFQQPASSRAQDSGTRTQ